jgi:hypothetical protein
MYFADGRNSWGPRSENWMRLFFSSSWNKSHNTGVQGNIEDFMNHCANYGKRRKLCAVALSDIHLFQPQTLCANLIQLKHPHAENFTIILYQQLSAAAQSATAGQPFVKLVALDRSSVVISTQSACPQFPRLMHCQHWPACNYLHVFAREGRGKDFLM